MELPGKLESNNTPKIGILPSAYRQFQNKLAEQCLHIIANNNNLNGLKGIPKMQKRESLFKYQSHF